MGAELAAVAYVVVQYLNGLLDVGWLQYLAHKPICQYVDRFRMVGFFVLLPYICKKSGIRKKDLGLCFSVKRYMVSFCGGFSLWVILFVVCISMVGGVVSKEVQTVSLVGIFFASLLLGVLEEVIFRGVVFEFFRKNYSKQMSMYLLALLFAALHFSMCSPGDAFNVFLHAAQCACRSLVSIPAHVQWPYFMCLFLLSCVLVQLRLKFDSLWCSIGFHQGLVFVLMLLRKKYVFTHYGNDFWGAGYVTDAWFSVIVLIFIFISLSCYRWMHEKVS